MTSSFCTPVEPGSCLIASSNSDNRLLLNWRRSAERASALRRSSLATLACHNTPATPATNVAASSAAPYESNHGGADELTGSIAKRAPARRNRLAHQDRHEDRRRVARR